MPASNSSKQAWHQDQLADIAGVQREAALALRGIEHLDRVHRQTDAFERIEQRPGQPLGEHSRHHALRRLDEQRIGEVQSKAPQRIGDCGLRHQQFLAGQRGAAPAHHGAEDEQQIEVEVAQVHE
jgi:hypothetical protein